MPKGCLWRKKMYPVMTSDGKKVKCGIVVANGAKDYARCKVRYEVEVFPGKKVVREAWVAEGSQHKLLIGRRTQREYNLTLRRGEQVYDDDEPVSRWGIVQHWDTTGCGCNDPKPQVVDEEDVEDLNEVHIEVEAMSLKTEVECAEKDPEEQEERWAPEGDEVFTTKEVLASKQFGHVKNDADVPDRREKVARLFTGLSTRFGDIVAGRKVLDAEGKEIRARQVSMKSARRTRSRGRFSAIPPSPAMRLRAMKR